MSEGEQRLSCPKCEQALDQKDPLEEDMVTHSCALAWRIPWTEEPDWLQFKGVQKIGHDRAQKYKS